MIPNFSLLEGNYLRDLLDEPEVLGSTLGGLKESAALSKLAQDLERGAFRRVVLTGMGASFFALHPLFLSARRASAGHFPYTQNQYKKPTRPIPL